MRLNLSQRQSSRRSHVQSLNRDCVQTFVTALFSLGAVIFGLSAVSTSAWAYENPCKDDVETYCRGIAPGGGSLRNCLGENKEKLSKECVEHRKRVKDEIGLERHERRTERREKRIERKSERSDRRSERSNNPKLKPSTSPEVKRNYSPGARSQP